MSVLYRHTSEHGIFNLESIKSKIKESNKPWHVKMPAWAHPMKSPGPFSAPPHIHRWKSILATAWLHRESSGQSNQLTRITPICFQPKGSLKGCICESEQVCVLEMEMNILYFAFSKIAKISLATSTLRTEVKPTCQETINKECSECSSS